MRIFSKIFVIGALVALTGCSDDGGENPAVDMGVGEQSDMSSSTDEDMGETTEQDMSANNSSLPDMDFGPCEPDEYLVTTDDSCAACPGTEFTCEGVLPNVTLDETTNVVTVTFDPTAAEIVEAEWDGRRTEGDGMSDTTFPINIEGSVDGDTITFDLSRESAGDELQLGRLRLVDGCEVTHAFTVLARWEPGGAVTVEPSCL